MQSPVQDSRIARLNWGSIYALLFCIAATFLFVRGFEGGLTGLICYGFLCVGMAILSLLTTAHVRPFQSLFLFSSPASVSFLTITFYFFVVLAVDKDVTAFSTAYVGWTAVLSLALIVTLWPMIRKLRYGSDRCYRVSAGAGLLCALSLLGWALLALAAAFSGIGSLWNVYKDPLQMRTFMSAGGMAYYKIVCDFLVLMPPKVAALKRYSTNMPSRAFQLLVFSGILYTLASGSRGATIDLVISLIMIRQFLGRPFRAIIFAVCALAVIPFVAIIGEYRSNPALYGGNMSELLKIAGYLGPEKVVSLFVARLDAPYYFNLLTQHRYSTKLSYGMSYLAWPLQAIPRNLWAGKPLLPNTDLTYRLVTGPGSHATFDFSIFGESYLNFGVMGIVFSALVIFVFFCYMQRRFQRMVESRSVSEVLYFVMLWAMPMYLIVSGLVAAATVTCMLLLQYWAARMLFFRRERGDG